jgi:RNA polymerase sigma-70 factor (ECF subfamily)
MGLAVVDRLTNSRQAREPEDQELVRLALEGDRSAFERLVSRHMNLVLNHLHGMLHDRERALDLCQETFLRLHRHLAEYRSDARLSTWLYRIATNLAIDEIRKSRRSRVLPFRTRREDGEPCEPEFQDARPGPEAQVLTEELREEVRAAVAGLPEAYRASLVLRDLQGLSYEEVAEALEVPVGTVKSRVNRARLLLRERLAPYLGNPGGGTSS